MAAGDGDQRVATEPERCGRERARTRVDGGCALSESEKGGYGPNQRG